jgi:hypothetical protein
MSTSFVRLYFCLRPAAGVRIHDNFDVHGVPWQSCGFTLPAEFHVTRHTGARAELSAAVSPGWD